jgi:hypothetical protein
VLTVGIAALIIGYLLLASGFHGRKADGSITTPLDELRAAFGKK